MGRKVTVAVCTLNQWALDFDGNRWICWDLFGPRLSQDTYLKKMRSAICYKMNVSRASGAACGSSYGRFCIFIWVENVSTADSDRGRLVFSFGSKKKR